MVVGAVILRLVNQHRRFHAAATLATQKEAGMLAEHTGRTLGAVDVVLQSVVAALETGTVEAPAMPGTVLRPLAPLAVR